ncbi:hypothetical protein MMC17_000984 [Xylographa soralifera]|nr:hypothetical protein [Xylographa soralifera]
MLYLSSTAATLLLLLHTALTTAQSTSSQIPSTLPACAQTCTALTQASQSCASNQATYQATLLSSLKTSSTNNICSPQCGDADFATIASWYNGQCGTSAAGALATTPSTLLTITISNAGSAPTGATTTEGAPSSATSSAGLQPNDAAPTNGPAWFSTHYQWVIMLIVLAVGLILLAILLTWLRKRHARRREAAENAGPHPAMEEWAPNQRSIHDIGNFGAAQAATTTSDTAKGKNRESTAVGRGTGSRRLKKTLFNGSKE